MRKATFLLPLIALSLFFTSFLGFGKSCLGLYSKREITSLITLKFEKIYPSPRVTSPTSPESDAVQVCILHLVLISARSGVPDKAKLYKNGVFSKEVPLGLTNMKNLFLIESFINRKEDVDFLVQITNREGEALLTSHPAVPRYYSFYPLQSNRVKIAWFKEKPENESFLEYVRSRSLEKLAYAVKENPFSGEISGVTAVVDSSSKKITRFEIEGIDEKGRRLTPLRFSSVENPYVLIKYDAAFSNSSFFWDDILISWFSIGRDNEILENTLDFWYSLQLKEGKNKGLIPREIRTTSFYLLKDSADILNKEVNPISFHPLSSDQIANPYLMSRVELELFYQTGRSDRLERSLESSISFFEWVARNRKSKKFVARVDKECPYYWTSNLGSGMDNSPRGGGNENWINFSEYGWFDLAAQQAALAKDIAQIAQILNKEEIAERFSRVYDDLKLDINECYFDRETAMWHDLKPGGELDKEAQTAAFVWGLYANLAERRLAKEIYVRWIENPDKFGGYPPLPTLARDHPMFDPNGNYWRGGNWAPIWWIAIQGLREVGLEEGAYRLASNVMAAMRDAYENYGSVFEFYAPTADSHGSARPGVVMGLSGERQQAKEDFLGWGKIPIPLSEVLGVETTNLELLERE